MGLLRKNRAFHVEQERGETEAPEGRKSHSSPSPTVLPTKTVHSTWKHYRNPKNTTCNYFFEFDLKMRFCQGPRLIQTSSEGNPKRFDRRVGKRRPGYSTHTSHASSSNHDVHPSSTKFSFRNERTKTNPPQKNRDPGLVLVRKTNPPQKDRDPGPRSALFSQVSSSFRKLKC